MLPQVVALLLVQARKRAHVRELVGEPQDVHLAVVGVAQLLDGVALALPPRLGRGQLRILLLGLGRHELGHAVAKLRANLVERHLGVLDHVMQQRRAQHVLV